MRGVCHINYSTKGLTGYEKQAVVIGIASASDFSSYRNISRKDFANALKTVLTTEDHFKKMPENFQNIQVLYEGTSQKECGNSSKALKLVPQMLIKAFSDEGGKLVLTSDHTVISNENAMGYFQWKGSSPEIHISTFDGYLEADKNGVVLATNSIPHEFGHFLDSINPGYFYHQNIDLQRSFSDKKEFSSMIYLTGRDYCMSSCEEYFAEAFEIYCVEPQVLKTKCPLAYQAISTAMSEQFL